MNVHLYDNIERRYRDGDGGSGLEVLTHLLAIDSGVVWEPVRYDLSIFSGGIGVFDQIAVVIRGEPSLWTALTASSAFNTPESLRSDLAWGDEFWWLVAGDDDQDEIDVAVVKFINSERMEFQEECTESADVVFGNCSDVNDWQVYWRTRDKINYRAFSQG